MVVESLENTFKVKIPYNHTHYERRRSFLRFLLKYLAFPLLAKIDRVEGLENIPEQGPAILMMNHIAFIDSIILVHAVPRNIVPLAKIEVYNYPVVGIFPKIWGVIPVRREEVDKRAVKQILEVLKAGEIVLIAPEGTRGSQLQPGKEGVAYLASRSGVPIVPVAVEGTKNFPALRFTNPWKGPGASIKFGRPFRFRSDYRRAGRDQLHKMMDEAMYILASMLPSELRGVYADNTNATQDTIEWI
jgi:1-acyl-sn-glycerol-3-phosphate acyltransferase